MRAEDEYHVPAESQSSARGAGVMRGAVMVPGQIAPGPAVACAMAPTPCPYTVLFPRVPMCMVRAADDP